MNNDEEFVQLGMETVNSLASSQAHSEECRINSEESEENVRQERPTESRGEGKKKRVNRQCVSKSSDTSDDNLLQKETKWELIRCKLEELMAITPNCPKSDINAILDHVIEYARSLRRAIFYAALHEYARNNDM